MNQREKRKILLDVYTDWCKWCERMDNETLQHPEVARYINKHFYPVKLNAEQRTEWQYKDKTYGFIRNGKRGYHELAYELMGGRMSFPTVIFMDEDLNVIQCIVGYKSVEQFEKILTYFATDHYKRTPWSTFQQMQESMLISD